MVNLTTHQQKQIEVIEQIENQIKANSLSFSTVSPVEDYDSDPRIALTAVHIPSDALKQKIQTEIIDSLKEVAPKIYFYPFDSLHMTVKNIKVINDPPHFSGKDIQTAKQVLSEVISQHSKFQVYFYRLLLFPNNLALMGTTDSGLDNLILDLDKILKEAGLPDDKQYINSQYFFSNITLARFSNPSAQFIKKVQELSSQLKFDPYTADSVSLVTCNAVFKRLQIIQTWDLI